MNPAGEPKFKMKFAPHIGMFKEHAGEDVLYQIQFMADQGFTALEDNSGKLKHYIAIKLKNRAEIFSTDPVEIIVRRRPK